MPTASEDQGHSPELLSLPKADLAVGELAKSQLASRVGELCSRSSGNCYLASDPAEAKSVALALQDELEVIWFPSTECLPYDAISPSPIVNTYRMRALASLPAGNGSLLVAPAVLLLERLPPPSYIKKRALSLKTGQGLNYDGFLKQLAGAGYEAVFKVKRQGQFAARGMLLDLYPSTMEKPIRIEFFDDAIDSLRFFDPKTQRSIKVVDSCEVLPAHSYPAGEENGFKMAWRRAFSDRDERDSALFQAAASGRHSPGMESYLPLFFAATACLQDYLSPKSKVILSARAKAAMSSFDELINLRYLELKEYSEDPLLPPEELFIPLKTALKKILPRSSVVDTGLFGGRSTAKKAGLTGNFSGNGKWREAPQDGLSSALAAPPPSGRAAEDFHLKDSLAEAMAVQGQLWKQGDYLVHRVHGVGIYRGIATIDSEGEKYTADYIKLEYPDGDLLYLSVHDLPLLTAYGSFGHPGVLDRLGKTKFAKAAKKAEAKARDLAAKMLARIASRRAKKVPAAAVSDSKWDQFLPYFQVARYPRSSQGRRRNKGSYRLYRCHGSPPLRRCWIWQNRGYGESHFPGF